MAWSHRRRRIVAGASSAAHRPQRGFAAAACDTASPDAASRPPRQAPSCDVLARNPGALRRTGLGPLVRRPAPLRRTRGPLPPARIGPPPRPRRIPPRRRPARGGPPRLVVQRSRGVRRLPGHGRRRSCGPRAAGRRRTRLADAPGIRRDGPARVPHPRRRKRRDRDHLLVTVTVGGAWSAARTATGCAAGRTHGSGGADRGPRTGAVVRTHERPAVDDCGGADRAVDDLGNLATGTDRGARPEPRTRRKLHSPPAPATFLP